MVQHCCAVLRRSRNERNVEGRWLKSLIGFILGETTPSNTQQDKKECSNGRNMQHPKTLKIVRQQCCDRLQIAFLRNCIRIGF